MEIDNNLMDEVEDMHEHMRIPGKLTKADVEALVEQLEAIRLPDGRKPFTVETRLWANHEVYLKNQCGTAVLQFQMAPNEAVAWTPRSEE